MLQSADCAALAEGGGGEVQHEDTTHSQISITRQHTTGHSSWTYDIPHTRPGAEWLFPALMITFPVPLH